MVSYFFADSSRKLLKDGSMPTLCLPQKSVETIETRKLPMRKDNSIAKRETLVNRLNVETNPTKVYHSDFDVVNKKAVMIKATGWNINLNADWLKISRDDPVYIVPKFEIHIDSSLGFSVRVFGWFLPCNHQIYIECRRSDRTLTLTNLMHLVSGYNICKGINRACSTPNGNTKEHIIPKHYKISDEDYDASTNQYEMLRSKACQILVSHQTCSECSCLIQQLTNNKGEVGIP